MLLGEAATRITPLKVVRAGAASVSALLGVRGLIRAYRPAQELREAPDPPVEFR